MVSLKGPTLDDWYSKSQSGETTVWEDIYIIKPSFLNIPMASRLPAWTRHPGQVIAGHVRHLGLTALSLMFFLYSQNDSDRREVPGHTKKKFMLDSTANSSGTSLHLHTFQQSGGLLLYGRKKLNYSDVLLKICIVITLFHSLEVIRFHLFHIRLSFLNHYNPWILFLFSQFHMP